nr:hypothetical protein [Gemmatimonadota bacterium]
MVDFLRHVCDYNYIIHNERTPMVIPRSLKRPILTLLLLTAGCTVIYHRIDDPTGLPEANVRPGISVLLSDSLDLVRGK